jgi:hypothetical protein
MTKPNVPRMPINPAVVPAVNPYYATMINWLHG